MTRPCPKCKTENPYPLRCRPGVFTCRNQLCKKQFTVTSDTALSRHKKPLEAYLSVVRMLVEGKTSVHAISKACGFRATKIYDLVQRMRNAMVSEEQKTACNHTAMGRAPSGSKIAACPTCGLIHIGRAHLWDACDLYVPVPFTEMDVFEASMKKILSVRYKDGKKVG